jgi:hypothetical protein
VSFTDINFGYADAHREGAEAPELLLDGFLDQSGITDEALYGPSFLFLGYKGSGKTALAERARLLSANDPALRVTCMSLEEFSYGDFRSLAGGAPAEHARFPTVWAWVLLLNLLQSLEQDEGGREAAPPSYTKTLQGLRALNVLPLPELTQLVTTSSKRGFKASIPKFFEYTEEKASEASELHIIQMVHVLREATLDFPAGARHVVFIDGLDEVLTRDDLQFVALAALVTEVSRLNDRFRAAGRPYKFVVLCRTDIFNRLPGANKNKIRRDGSHTLEWFDDPRALDDTPLLRLVNLRASRSLGEAVNVFDAFLPPKLNGRPIRRALLDYTRHLPRDVLQLMKSLQKFARPGQREKLSSGQVMSGVREYSNDYFLHELQDELHGYLEPSDVENSISLLGSLGASRFTIDDLKAQAARLDLHTLDVDVLVRTLFDRGGLGMLEKQSPGQRGIVSFKYRNRNAILDRDAELLIHRGALRALNIPEPN